MLYNYVATLFFAVLGISIPLLFLLLAKLLSRNSPGNPAKNAPYESAEESTGGSRDIDNEYLPYFMLFLPFEVVLAMLMLWATVAKSTDYNTSIGIIILTFLSMVLSIVGYKIIGVGTGRTNAVYK